MNPPPGGDTEDVEPPQDGGPREAAHYIMGVLDDLTRVARHHRHDMLVYLLNMARMEADEIVRQGPRRAGSG